MNWWDMLGKVIGDCFTWLGRFITSVFHFVQAYQNFKWTIFILIIGWTWSVAKLLPDMVDKLTDLFDVANPDNLNLTAPSGAGEYLAIANTFFPLDLVCTYLIAYAGLVIALTVYRHVKSWVPLWGNS